MYSKMQIDKLKVEKIEQNIENLAGFQAQGMSKMPMWNIKKYSNVISKRPFTNIF